MDKKVIIIIVVNSVLLLILMGGGFMFMFSKMSPVSAEDVKTDDKHAGNEKGEVVELGPVFPLETFIVNLAGEDGRRYLRITIELQLDGQKMVEEIEKRKPQIRDQILMILSSMDVQEILTADGKDMLRRNIINGINGCLKSGTISNIYFTELVIQ